MSLVFKAKLDKILELLLYLAHSKPRADLYQAVKFFYLADREHLNRHGRPITNEEYYALPYGPVASKAMDFLRGNQWVFKEAGISELPFETHYEKKNGYDVLVIGEPKRDYDPNMFSKSDLKIFDEIVAEFGDFTFDELFELTHSHFAYDRAWSSRKHGTKRAEMRYEEMIEDDERRAQIVEDIGLVSAHFE